MVGDLAARDDPAAEPVAALTRHAELHQPVGDQNPVSHRDVAHEARVDDRDPARGPEDAPRGDGDLVTRAQPDDAALKLSHAEPRSLQVEQESDVLSDPLGGRADAADGAGMVSVGAVGKIEARDIHPGADHPGEDGGVGRGRPDGGDDLGTARGH